MAEMVKKTSNAVDTILGMRKRMAQPIAMKRQKRRGAAQRSGSWRWKIKTVS